MAEILSYLYLQKPSWVHSLNFWTKFICLLLIFPIIILFANSYILVVATVLCIILVKASHISMPEMWDKVKFYILAYTLIFIPIAVLWGTGRLESRLQQGLIFALRMTDVTMLGVLFAIVTDPMELPLGLIQLRLPHKYGVALMVAYRMLPLMTEKMTNILRAQKSRGADFRVTVRRLPQIAKSGMSLLIPLISSSLDASVALADTLIARGYSPQRRITVPPRRFKVFDLVLPLLLGLFLAFSLYLR